MAVIRGGDGVGGEEGDCMGLSIRLSDYNPFPEQTSQETYVAEAQGWPRHTHSDGGGVVPISW